MKKNSKTFSGFTSIVLAFVFVMSLCTVCSANVGSPLIKETLKVFIADNFERGVTGNGEEALLDVQTGSLGAASGCTIVNDPVYGNVLKAERSLNDTNPDAVNYTIEFSVGSATSIATEFDFKLAENLHYSWCWAELCKSGAYGGNDNMSAWYSRADGYMYNKDLPVTGNNGIVLTDTDCVDKWYSIRVLYDLTTGRSDWYAANRGETLNYMGSYVNAQKIVPGRFSIRGLGVGSKVYIDNLKVYEYTEHELPALIEVAEKDLKLADTPELITCDSTATAVLSNALSNAKTVASNPAATKDELNAAANQLRIAYQDFMNGEQPILSESYKYFSLDTHAQNTSVTYGDGSTVNIEVDDTNDADKSIRGSYQTALNMTGNNNRVVIESYQKTPEAAEGIFCSEIMTIEFSFKQTEKSAYRELMSLWSNGASLANVVFWIQGDGEKIYFLDESESKSLTLLDSYNINQWYKVMLVLNFHTKEIAAYVDGERKLIDKTIPFYGSSFGGSYTRIQAYGPATGTNYLAGIELILDRARMLSAGLDEIKASVPADIADAPKALCSSIPIEGGINVTWTSNDFAIKSNMVSAGTAVGSGTLTSQITFRGRNYSGNYVIPVATSAYCVDSFTLKEGTNDCAISASLHKTSLSTSEIARMLVAYYDADDRLIGAETVVDTSAWMLPTGETATISKRAEIPQGGSVMAFIWDDSLRPYKKPLVVGKKKSNALENYSIACWGDSYTQGAGASCVAASYPSVLAEMTGAEVYNMGIGGETATTIAARQGGLDIELPGEFTLDAGAGSSVSFNADTFKASNGVTIMPRATTIAGWNPCTLNGIEGVLTAEVDTSQPNIRTLISATFTRTADGEALHVSNGETATLLTAGSQLQADINVVYIGLNGGWNAADTCNADDLVGITQNMVAHMEQPSKYIIVGLTAGGEDTIDALDTAMLSAFGDRFLNVREYLSSKDALDYTGITPTLEDWTCIQKGQVPASFMAADNAHLNDAGYRAFAKCVYDRLVMLYQN